MPSKSSRTHELIREQLSAAALGAGRKLYLHAAVRELRIDARRRRYSAIIEEEGQASVTVKIEHPKGGPSWICSQDGRDSVQCAHVAALLTAIREREASEIESPSHPARSKPKRVNLVSHLLAHAERDHLAQAFRLCLRSYPELQGDLVFTILEHIDEDGSLYEEVVALMDDPASPSAYFLPREGFDSQRLLDEINYLYEQERYQQSFLLCRAVLRRLLRKLDEQRQLNEAEVDLIIASSGMLSDLALPPAPEHLLTQVHELGLRLLDDHPRIEPQIQSSLIALLDDELLGEEALTKLEKRLRQRWNKARKSVEDKARGGKSKAAFVAEQASESERLAMPLALLYARTRQFGKLQSLFDSHLRDPLLRAPALAEMLHHNLHELVVHYVQAALVSPPADQLVEDHQDLARCQMYNDLVMMLLDGSLSEQQRSDLLTAAFTSIGHRVYGLVDVLREQLGTERANETLEALLNREIEAAAQGSYPAVAKTFILLAETEAPEAALDLLQARGLPDPVLLLDYLPTFLPAFQHKVLGPALEALGKVITEPQDEELRQLVHRSIDQLMDIDEAATHQALEERYPTIIDDELADYIELVLGELDLDESED